MLDADNTVWETRRTAKSINHLEEPRWFVPAAVSFPNNSPSSSCFVKLTFEGDTYKWKGLNKSVPISHCHDSFQSLQNAGTEKRRGKRRKCCAVRSLFLYFPLCVQVFTLRSLNLISSDFVFTLKAVCLPISATLVIDPSHVQLAKWGF